MLGILSYNYSHDAIILLFLASFEFSVGLYCGACLDVNINGNWFPTRIERSVNDEKWYLVGVSRDVKLSGLPVRI